MISTLEFGHRVFRLARSREPASFCFLLFSLQKMHNKSDIELPSPFASGSKKTGDRLVPDKKDHDLFKVHVLHSQDYLTFHE